MASTEELPDQTARALYLSILADGGRLPFAALDDLDDTDRAALDQLVSSGLVLPNALDRIYLAVSPRSVGERLCTELRSTATRLLLRAEELPDELSGLTRAYESAPRVALEPDRPSYLDGRQQIRQRIAELLSECRFEVLTAQPGTRHPETLAVARPQDLALRRRGIRMCTVYQPGALAEPHTVDYAVALSAQGSELRILDEPYQRILIIDRAVAVVPAAPDGLGRAAFISDPTAVAFLVAVYQRDWDRAETVDWSRLGGASQLPAAAHRVGRMLATGLTQRAVAGRLGLSERTVAGHIARLREQYGAQTLFQLGWQMRGGRGD
ncbi:LuxR family transcriptional regulator [Kitasatospora sp. NBC_00070]|uniref:LuxR family transcriptional regulator n=1 Tax=Kitasatospora sp. NBC_00070 TaxID=2975962 RepID=UPI00324323E3